jgi:hypothetical protein
MLPQHLPAEGYVGLVRQLPGAERLEINLVQAQILLKEAEILLQLPLLRAGGSLSNKIGNKLKITILAHLSASFACGRSVKYANVCIFRSIICVSAFPHKRSFASERLFF